MKKYIIKIVSFFFAVTIIDAIFGVTCQYLNDHSKGGGVKNRYYVCKESNEDILIFGSSRAKHHYVPDIIEDSLGMTCYNMGEDGNGIILCYGYLKMISKRYKPQLIIYDVNGFDMYEDDNSKYLDLLKPYYYEPGIDSLFWMVNPKSRYMMFSNLFRFNTTCLRIVGAYFHPTENNHKGYAPLHKTMDYEPKQLVPKQVAIDSLKIHLFEQFIQLTKSCGTSLVCCVSPTYKGSEEMGFNPIKSLCNQYEIPFLFYGATPEIIHDKSYFQDKFHLNDKGACYFTKLIVNQIINY